MDPIKTTSCSTKYKATLKEKCKIGNTRRGALRTFTGP